MRCRLGFFLLLVSLVWSSFAYAAASKQYVAPGPDILFGDSAQTPAKQITFNALASAAGRYSTQYDKGTGSQPANYWWRCWFVLNGTPSVGSAIEIYIFTGMATTHIDGELGTTDAALPSADRRRNGKLVGTINVDQTTASPTLTGSGSAFIPTRYFTLGVWNGTALALTASSTAHSCIFNAEPFEMQ